MRWARVVLAASALLAAAVFVGAIFPELTLRRDWPGDPPFQEGDPPWLTIAAARIGSAGGFTPTGLLLLAGHQLGAGNLNLLTATLGTVTAALVAFASLRLSAPVLALAVTAASTLSPLTWTMMTASEGDVRPVLAATLLVAAIVCVVEWTGERHRTWLAAAAILVATAAADDLALAIFLLPLGWLASTAGGVRPSRVIAAMAGLAIAAALLHGLELVRVVYGPSIAAGAVDPPTSLQSASLAIWNWGLPIAPEFRLDRRAAGALPLVVTNLTVLGAGVALVGAAALVRSTAGLLTAIAGVAVIGLGPWPGPWSGHAYLPLFTAGAWVLVARGLTTLGSWPATDGLKASLLVGVALATIQGGRMLAVAPGSVDRASAGAIGHLVASLPSDAVLVSERVRLSRLLDRMTPSPTAPRPTLVAHSSSAIAAVIDGGRAVFATEAATSRLSLVAVSGYDVPVRGRTLEDAAKEIPRDAVVAIGATPNALRDPRTWKETTRLLGLDGRADAPTGPFGAVAQPGDGRVATLNQSDAELRIDRARPMGLAAIGLPDAGVRVTATAAGAAIALDDREIAYSPDGVVLATWMPDTREWRQAAFDRMPDGTTAWQVPGLALTRLATHVPCTTISDSWSEVSTQTRSGRIGVTLDGQSTMRFVVVHDAGLSFRVGAFDGRPAPRLVTDAWDRSVSGQADAAGAALRADGVDHLVAPHLARHVWRLDLHSDDRRPGLAALAFGGTGVRLWARRQDSGLGGTISQVCAGPGGVRVFPAGESSRESAIALEDREGFGAGWGVVESGDGDRWRGLTSPTAELLVHSGRSGSVTIAIDTSLAGATTAAFVSIAVDGHLLASQAVSKNRTTWEWTIDRAHWTRGLHHVVLSSSGVAQPVADAAAIRIHSIRLRQTSAE